ncbi:MAG TPA: hypothetical protein VF517_06170, partial [Thermoleophilaceae bacterium]
VLFAVIGLSGDNDEGGGKTTPTEQTSAERQARERRERRERREARERREKHAASPRLVLRVVPTGPTYVCVDDGRGKVTFEGTIGGPRSFRARRGGRLRINLGRAAVRLTANGRRVRVPDGPSGAGFSFTRTGRATPLGAEQRPCA